MNAQRALYSWSVYCWLQLLLRGAALGIILSTIVTLSSAWCTVGCHLIEAVYLHRAVPYKPYKVWSILSDRVAEMNPRHVALIKLPRSKYTDAWVLNLRWWNCVFSLFHAIMLLTTTLIFKTSSVAFLSRLNVLRRDVANRYSLHKTMPSGWSGGRSPRTWP